MQLDILAFGAHPDDVEIGIGGTLVKHAAMGYKCGIVDLTAGEMGSNGTPAIRRKEALRAAEIMGMETRECLNLPDARLHVDEESTRRVVEVVRKYQPKVVVGPYWQDRHPDHIRASQLVRDGAHLAGLWKYPADGDPYRPPVMAQYFLAVYDGATFVVDISEQYETKLRALGAHESQFGLSEDTDWKTLVNDPHFLRMIQSRDMYVGSLIQVSFGEGIYLEEKMSLDDLMSLRGRVRKLTMERIKKDVNE